MQTLHKFHVPATCIHDAFLAPALSQKGLPFHLEFPEKGFAFSYIMEAPPHSQVLRRMSEHIVEDDVETQSMMMDPEPEQLEHQVYWLQLRIETLEATIKKEREEKKQLQKVVNGLQCTVRALCEAVQDVTKMSDDFGAFLKRWDRQEP